MNSVNKLWGAGSVAIGNEERGDQRRGSHCETDRHLLHRAGDRARAADVYKRQLLDLAMPELNGAEVASVLKGAMPDTRIILFTMYRENVGKYLSSAVGIDVVLSKPDGGTKLAAAIDSALDQISD